MRLTEDDEMVTYRRKKDKYITLFTKNLVNRVNYFAFPVAVFLSYRQLMPINAC